MTAAPACVRLPCSGHLYHAPRPLVAGLGFVVGIFVLLFRGARQELWADATHLLVVSNNGYQESYRRVAFHDVQALVVQRTAQLPQAALVLGIGIVLHAAVALSFPLAVYSYVGAAAGLLVLVHHLLRGPVASVQLVTGVQTLDLPALARVRRHHRALEELRRRILAAQGALDPAQLAATPPPAAPPPS
jgi:hypothetical protein